MRNNTTPFTLVSKDVAARHVQLAVIACSAVQNSGLASGDAITARANYANFRHMHHIQPTEAPMDHLHPVWQALKADVKRSLFASLKEGRMFAAYANTVEALLVSAGKPKDTAIALPRHKLVINPVTAPQAVTA